MTQKSIEQITYLESNILSSKSDIKINNTSSMEYSGLVILHMQT